VVEEEVEGRQEERRWGRRARPSRVNDESSAAKNGVELRHTRQHSAVDVDLAGGRRQFSSTGHALGACLTPCKGVSPSYPDDTYSLAISIIRDTE